MPVDGRYCYSLDDPAVYDRPGLCTMKLHDHQAMPEVICCNHRAPRRPRAAAVDVHISGQVSCSSLDLTVPTGKTFLGVVDVESRCCVSSVNVFELSEFAQDAVGGGDIGRPKQPLLNS